GGAAEMVRERWQLACELGRRGGRSRSTLGGARRRRSPDLAGSGALVGGSPTPRAASAAASGLRVGKAERRVAGPGNQGAALPLSARGDAAPGVYGARLAGGRDGTGQDDPGDRRVRVIASAGPGAAGAGGDARLAQDRMGGADPALHGLELPA